MSFEFPWFKKNNKSTRPYYTKYVPPHSSQTTIATTQATLAEAAAMLVVFSYLGLCSSHFFSPVKNYKKNPSPTESPPLKPALCYMSLLHPFTYPLEV